LNQYRTAPLDPKLYNPSPRNDELVYEIPSGGWKILFNTLFTLAAVRVLLSLFIFVTYLFIHLRIYLFNFHTECANQHFEFVFVSVSSSRVGFLRCTRQVSSYVSSLIHYPLAILQYSKSEQNYPSNSYLG
jgi:hypothetical protein